MKTWHEIPDTKCGSLCASMKQNCRQRVLAIFPFGDLSDGEVLTTVVTPGQKNGKIDKVKSQDRT
jgi:hypothetical protein